MQNVPLSLTFSVLHFFHSVSPYAPTSNLRSALSPLSIAVTTTMKIRTTTRTTPVDLTIFPKDGQLTFLSSEKTSLIFLPILTKIFGFFFLSFFFATGFSAFVSTSFVSFSVFFMFTPCRNDCGQFS